jgi:two-component system response regulator FixJ
MSDATMVHIVDDDAGMRKSLQMVMDSNKLPARAYESARQFLEEADLHTPACIILDLRMPGMGGLDLLRELKSRGLDLPVIIISGHVDVKAAIGSMKLGAIDVLSKPFEPKELVAAARKAIQKSVEFHQRQAETEAIRERIKTLTQRELDLLKLVVAGNSNKQIAADLDISIKTVANHRANLMAKTQALNAADLARMSTIAGVVSKQ